MLKLAVTGGIASGKSAVCQIFQNLGAYCVSLDLVVHQLLSSDNDLIQNVVSLLGEEILSEGVIDRKKVAQHVFTSPVLLEKLEKLIHPRVQVEMEKRLTQAKGYTLFVVEIPLLFETGMESWFDKTIAVVADETECLTRFCKSGEYKKEDYFQRMKRQLLPAEKAKRANFIINNNGSLHDLTSQVSALYYQLTGVSA